MRRRSARHLALGVIVGLILLGLALVGGQGYRLVLCLHAYPWFVCL